MISVGSANSKEEERLILYLVYLRLLPIIGLQFHFFAEKNTEKGSTEQSTTLYMSLGILTVAVITLGMVTGILIRKRRKSKKRKDSFKIRWSRNRTRSRAHTYDHITRETVHSSVIFVFNHIY